MTCYLDTSVAIKLYVKESDSTDWLSWVGNQEGPLHSSQLLKIELAFALVQKERRGEILENAAIEIYQHFLGDVSTGRFSLHPLDPTVLTKAMALAFLDLKLAVPLRTLDGLHLASAIRLGFTQIATTDKRLASVAERVGIRCAVPASWL